MERISTNFKSKDRDILKRFFDFLYLYLIPFTILIFISESRSQQYYELVPPDQRGNSDYVRQGTHDANRIRTMFYNL